MGLATARCLLRYGASVGICARDALVLQQAHETLAMDIGGNGRLFSCQCDVACAEDVEKFVADAQWMLGVPDILVCNAGIHGPIGVTECTDWGQWVHALEVNLLGTVLCCRAVLPGMKQRYAGKIVIVAGGGATSPRPNVSAYAVSKAGVVRFAETLAHEVQSYDIEVNAVSPGAMNTRLMHDLLAAGRDRVGAEYERVLEQARSGGSPPELAAELIALLASSASDGITGRLISAVWDDWRNLPGERDALRSSDKYTLRRVI